MPSLRKHEAVGLSVTTVYLTFYDQRIYDKTQAIQPRAFELREFRIEVTFKSPKGIKSKLEPSPHPQSFSFKPNWLAINIHAYMYVYVCVYEYVFQMRNMILNLHFSVRNKIMSCA